MKYYKHITVVLIFLYCIAISTSCKKIIQIDQPVGQLTKDKVLADDQTATAVLSGIYQTLSKSGCSVNPTVSNSCLADELVSFSNSSNSYYNNNVPVDDLILSGMWSSYYSAIYQTNVMLEGLVDKNGVSTGLKVQMTGELKFIRAFSYFQLVNLFGDVPLVLTSDVRKTMVLPRSSKTIVYDQIVNDLKEAQASLTENYATVERVRINKATATALLARIYLYQKNYTQAEIESSKVINNKTYNLEGDLNSIFLKNSKETIFQLWTDIGYLGMGYAFIPVSDSDRPNMAFTSSFMSSFEEGDSRKDKWIKGTTYQGNTYYYPFKYKMRIKDSNGDNTEYFVVLRLAEQYLIRAEARINSGKISLGVEDLNILRGRARATPTVQFPNPLPALDLNLSLTDARNVLERERRVELFTEWGHRWFDLKRTDRANAVLSVEKPLVWNTRSLLLPIPLSELTLNQNLVQNSGY